MTSIQFPVQLKDPSLLDSRGLIAGKWAHAPDCKTFSVHEPSSGEVLQHAADFPREAFVEAIENAHQAYQSFDANTTAKERGTILRRWNDLIIENIDDCEFS